MREHNFPCTAFGRALTESRPTNLDGGSSGNEWSVLSKPRDRLGWNPRAHCRIRVSTWRSLAGEASLDVRARRCLRKNSVFRSNPRKVAPGKPRPPLSRRSGGAGTVLGFPFPAIILTFSVQVKFRVALHGGRLADRFVAARHRCVRQT